MNRRPLMRTDEVAELLGTSPWMVRKLIRRGDLAAYDKGSGRRRDYRVSEEQLEQYLSARSTSAA